MVKLFANSGDPDQMPHSALSDLGLHYLPVTLLWVSQLQWVKELSRLDLHCSQRYLSWAVGIKGLNLTSHLVWICTVCKDVYIGLQGLKG